MRDADVGDAQSVRGEWIVLAAEMQHILAPTSGPGLSATAGPARNRIVAMARNCLRASFIIFIFLLLDV